jgi:dihydroxyacetone kinase-like predicted kinase
MKPVEGTILTVLRGGPRGAVAASRERRGLDELLKAGFGAVGRETLKHTPDSAPGAETGLG